MGDTKTTLWQELTQGFGKILIYAWGILIGVMGKLAFDSRTGHLTRRQIIYKSAISVFVGIIAATICDNLDSKEWGRVIVPVATLMGEGLVGWAMTNVDWSKVGNALLPPWIQNLFKKK